MKQHHSILGRAALLALALALAACDGAPQALTPTAPPAPTAAPTAAPAPTDAPTDVPAPTGTPTERQISAGIQAALDLYSQAYNQNDRDALRQMLDLDNRPFSRFVQTRFDDYQRGFLGGKLRYHFAVTHVAPRDAGFVQAQVEVDGGAVAEWLFRRVGDRWLLSEPSVEQIGARVTLTQGRFIFHTYPWAADVNATIIDLMERAHDAVVARLGREPEQIPEVDIRPIYGLTPFDTPLAAAYYAPGSGRAADRIEIYTPNSYIFGFYDPAQGWQAELLTTLTHEYTHMVHRRSFDNAGQLSDWMVEGLAEYVAGNTRSYEVRAAVRADTIIPIVDSVTPVYKQDLQHLAALDQDKSLAYGLACSLVTYIAQTYGGLDGFWKLARAYDKHQDLDKALREAFGVSYAQFDQDWRTWLRTSY